MNDETTPQPGVSRRSVLKKGAIAGGALVWATPVVQSFGGTASGQAPREGSPRCDASASALDLASTSADSSGRVTFELDETTSCGPCPDGAKTITWLCQSTSNFTCDAPPAPAAASNTYGGTKNAGVTASVTVQATVAITCEDGDTASDCRAEQFNYAASGNVTSQTEQTCV